MFLYAEYVYVVMFVEEVGEGVASVLLFAFLIFRVLLGAGIAVIFIDSGEGG